MGQTPSRYSPMWNDTKALPPVSLPVVTLSDGDIEREAKEATQRVAERRMIREAVDCWREIGRAESFRAWIKIGRALMVGKAHALKITGANAPWGASYCKAFNVWMKHHHFDGMMKSVRSAAIELGVNAEAISRWRETLPERKRRSLIHPLSNVRAWRKATNPQPRQIEDKVKAAAYAWRHFVALMEALPAEQAAPLWQAVQAQAMKALEAATPSRE